MWFKWILGIKHFKSPAMLRCLFMINIIISFYRIGLHQMELLRTDLINVIKKSNNPKVSVFIMYLLAFSCFLIYSILKRIGFTVKFKSLFSVFKNRAGLLLRGLSMTFTICTVNSPLSGSS